MSQISVFVHCHKSYDIRPINQWLISGLELGLLVSENIKVRMSVTFPARSHNVLVSVRKCNLNSMHWVLSSSPHSLTTPTRSYEGMGKESQPFSSLSARKWWVPIRSNSNSHFHASSDSQAGDCLSGPVCVCSTILIRIYDTSDSVYHKNQFSFNYSLIDLFILSVIFKMTYVFVPHWTMYPDFHLFSTASCEEK